MSTKVALGAFVDMPEINVAFFSFILHFVWEFIQAPLFAGMAEMNHGQGIVVCTEATVGDVGIALTAYWAGAAAARSRLWILNPSVRSLLVFLGVGVGLTIGLEYYSTEMTNRWAYADIMPLVPPFGTGLSPLLQWIVVPLLVVFIVRRQLARFEMIRARQGEQADA
jgi:hypothetical protein